MPPITLFFLKSVICSAILLAYYMLMLKNSKLHNFNRWYLLGAALVSLVLPLLHIELFHVSHSQAASFPILQVMGAGTEEQEITTSERVGMSLFDTAFYIYLAITVVLLLAMTIRIVWIYSLKRKHGAVRMDGFWLVRTSLRAAPFSFLNTLFWREGILLDSPEGRNIITHELAHIRQKHTLDKILMQLIVSFFWLNPFFWIMRKELWLQHEFIADDCAIADGDTDLFARMLLQANYSAALPSTVNLFFHSPIKRRLMMFTNNNTPTYSRARRLLALPLLIVTATMFSFTTGEPGTDVNPAKEKITLVLDAAHGGKDVGGRSKTGEQEKDMTLKICSRIAELAPQYNISVVPTRTGDNYPTLPDRIEKSNSTNADLFLSIHISANAADMPGANDYELGVSNRNASYKQGTILASALAPRLRSAGVSPRLVERNGVLVLSKNKHTSLLLECGNINDQANIAFLNNDAKLESLCRGILAGIVDYQGKN